MRPGSSIRDGTMTVTEEERHKSLQDLEGVDWGEPTFPSHLVTTCHRLHRTPLQDFTVEDLRIMIGQQMGLPYLVPLALEHLRVNPFVSGDFYPGDLLKVVMLVAPAFWQTHPDLWYDADDIIEDLRHAYEQFSRDAPTFEAWGHKAESG